VGMGIARERERIRKILFMFDFIVSEFKYPVTLLKSLVTLGEH